MATNSWLEWALRPAIVSVMIGAVALSLVELMRELFPRWNGTYLVALCMLAALEGYYAYRVLHLDVTRMRDPIRFRLVELVMFFLVVRMATLLHDQGSFLPARIAYVDLETAASYVLVMLCWLGATNTSRDFMRVGEIPEPSYRYVPPIDLLASRYFSGGAVLLLAAGLSRVQVSQMFVPSRPSISGIVLNVLVYFVLGIVLLGQVRFSALQSRWKTNDMRITGDMSARWVRYSLTFLGLVAALAYLLPTSYTVGLLDIMRYLVSVISALTLLLSLVVLYPVGWLLAHLLPLGATHPPRPPHMPTPPRNGAHDSSWSGLLKSLLFWAVVALCVAYMLRSYAQHHLRRWGLVSRVAPLLRFLRRLWTALRRGVTEYAHLAIERLPRIHFGRSGRPGVGGARRFFRLSAASPREQILYYYLSILRRAQRQGFPRGRGQTPYEFSTTLGPALSEAQPDMDQLTRAFVEARYSRRDVEPVQAGWARTSWERVKAALRSRRRPEKREPSTGR